MTTSPAVVLAEPPAELTVTAETVVDVSLRLLVPQFLLKLQGVGLLPQCVFLPAERPTRHDSAQRGGFVCVSNTRFI